MKTLRWVAVPIVAIITPFIAHFLMSTIFRLIDWGLISVYINALVRDFSVGYATVTIPTAVAPSAKSGVASVLCVIWCIICLVSLVLLIINGQGFFNYLSIIVGAIGGIVGATSVYGGDNMFESL